MSKLLHALLLFALVDCSRAALAQTPLPIYDAVTIKPSDAAARGTHIDIGNTTFQARNVSLRHLLVNASGIRENLISGLPKWADTTRYDINAKVTEPDIKRMRSLSRQQGQAMVAAMLADRFHLVSHIEIKTLPVYELVVAKDGPKLKSSATADPADPGQGNMNISNTDLTATSVLLSQLAGDLSMPLDRTVIDKTNLPGRYDFHLQWTADNAADNAPADAPPTLLTALEEQLGLKLQPAKGPVSTLVIDHVEQPTGN